MSVETTALVLYSHGHEYTINTANPHTELRSSQDISISIDY